MIGGGNASTTGGGQSMQRRSLMLVAPRRLEWVTEHLAQPDSDELLVETLAGAISIGTELPHYLGNSRNVAPDAYPLMTGYESVGRVLAVGPNVRQPDIGARVFSFYGHRSHAVIPAAKAVAVPDWAGDGLALLGILSCDVAKGVRKLAPDPAEPVLVTGAGTIGLLAVWTLVAHGSRAVDVVEPSPARRELAMQLGARHALARDALDERTSYPYAIECSSRQAAFALLQSRMTHHGHICILADGNLEPLTLTPHFHAKELTITASSDGDDYHAHAAWFFDTTRRTGTADALERLFGWHVHADDLPDTFERLATEREVPPKVLVRYARQG
jgi:alcohol dehydrogenase